MTERFTEKLETDVPSLIRYASGSTYSEMNDPNEHQFKRRQKALDYTRSLNRFMESTPRVHCQNAKFRGYLPERPNEIAAIQGDITGMAWEFRVRPHHDKELGIVGRYIIVLAIVDFEGYVTINGEDFKANKTLEYEVDLAHSFGPFEEIA